MQTTTEPEKPTVTTYTNEYPTMADFFSGGGRPGYEYAIVNAANMATFHGNSWEQVLNIPPFIMAGPEGQCSCMLMRHGTPISGSDPINGVRELFVDKSVDRTTGLKKFLEKEAKRLEDEAAKLAAKDEAQALLGN